MNITCGRCQEVKHASNFYKNSRSGTGYYSMCKECKRERRRQRYHSNPSVREKRLSYNRKWIKESGLSPVYAEERSASLREATPNWLTDEQLSEIRQIYQKAAELSIQTGIQHHVDHIYPLNHSICRGLHVPWNLQIVPYYVNLSKGNKLPEEIE